MTGVVVRPTIAEDLGALTDEPLPWRIKAMTMVRGDEVLAVGGVAFLPDGTVAAFLEAKEDARKYPVALHKAARRMHQELRDMGIRRIVALSRDEAPRAVAWLMRFGFERKVYANSTCWVWNEGARA